MKIRKLLGGLILSTVLVAGVSVFAGSYNKKTEKVEAATATTVYYAVDTEYTVKCNVHYGSGQSDPWDTFVMSKVDGTYGVYKATFTDKWDGLATLQFQLYDGTTQKESKEVISSWTGPSTYNNKLYYNGNWVTSFKEVKKTTTLTSSTGRVFFNNSGTHWGNGTCAVYAWGGDASQTIDSNITMEGTFYHFNWFEDSNDIWYGYADIPTNITGYKIAKLNSDAYVTSLSYDSDNAFTPDSFACVKYGQSNGNYISEGGAKDDVADTALMTAVINAYNTCSDSVLNGYGAYSALNTNFYSHATDAAKSAIATSLGGKSATIQAHFEGMAQRSVGANSSSALIVASITKGGSMIIIIVISAISLAAVGGYFLFRKKKEK